jgi:hypothetical protein
MISRPNDMTTSNSRVYSPLPSAKSIRLLRLEAGVEREPISCSLIIIDNYALAPEYHAISYCWGDVNDASEITCNGWPFSVTKSLHGALVRLRDKPQSHLLWADAICINQPDNLERNQQVSIMRQIYIHASRVIIWLGHGDEHTEQALQIIRILAHGCGKQYLGFDYSSTLWLATIRGEPDKSKFFDAIRIVRPEHVPHTSWHSFWNFYQSDWFFRVWVIQEVTRSADVRLLCGTEDIEWDFVALAAAWPCIEEDRDRTVIWRKSHFITFDGFRHALFMWMQPSYTRMEVPFLALLDLVRGFHSTEPKDKVFALLQHPIVQIQQLGRYQNYPFDILDTVSHSTQGCRASDGT